MRPTESSNLDLCQGSSSLQSGYLVTTDDHDSRIHNPCWPISLECVGADSVIPLHCPLISLGSEKMIEIQLTWQ